MIVKRYPRSIVLGISMNPPNQGRRVLSFLYPVHHRSWPLPLFSFSSTTATVLPLTQNFDFKETYRFLREISDQSLRLCLLRIYLSEILVYPTISNTLSVTASVGSISKITRDSTSESRNEFTAVKYDFILCRLYTLNVLCKHSLCVSCTRRRDREDEREKGQDLAKE